ncbi:MAG: Hpt domain-containing protein [Candidatus Omnitrophota bacterium]
MKWDRQKALQELGIPEGLYDGLVVGFSGQSEGVMLDLEKAFQEKDFEKIARSAHFIKGAAGNLRIEEIYLTAKELETAAKIGLDLETIELRVKSLKSLMEELKKNI